VAHPRCSVADELGCSADVLLEVDVFDALGTRLPGILESQAVEVPDLLRSWHRCIPTLAGISPSKSSPKKKGNKPGPSGEVFRNAVFAELLRLLEESYRVEDMGIEAQDAGAADDLLAGEGIETSEAAWRHWKHAGILSAALFATVHAARGDMDAAAAAVERLKHDVTSLQENVRQAYGAAVAKKNAAALEFAKARESVRAAAWLQIP
jgi:hypothetical protein